MQDLQAELAGRMGEAEWDWLAPHAERDALVIVSPQLDLLEVGVAIASDNTTHVQRWIDERMLVKPTRQQLQAWGKASGKRFNALILQPYVLIQDVV